MNRRLDQRTLDYFVRKPIRLWWVLLPLMGFDCVMSEHPLMPASEGFIDRAVIGNWASATDAEGKLALSVARSESGMLEIRVYDHDEEGVPYLRYRAFSSRLGTDTFANLELIGYGCNNCDGNELMRLRTEIFDPLTPIVAGRAGTGCTFIHVKYEHTGDDRLILHGHDDGSIVRTAIEQRQIAGRIFDQDARDLAGKPCITDTAERLREFYAANATAFFPASRAETFVRQPRATAPE